MIIYSIQFLIRINQNLDESVYIDFFFDVYPGTDQKPFALEKRYLVQIFLLSLKSIFV